MTLLKTLPEKFYAYLLTRQLRSLNYSTRVITTLLTLYGQLPKTDVKKICDEIERM